MPDTTTQSAYLAGGCFWGMEELVRQIPGVLETEAGKVQARKGAGDEFFEGTVSE